MNINYFYEKLKEKVDYLLEKDVYFDKRYSDGLGDATWTAIINTAIYLIVDEYNKDKTDKDRILIQPESGGRGGFSDFLLVSDNGKIEELEIEHENAPKGVSRRKLTENKLDKSILNLKKSHAKIKVLITYTYPKLTYEELKIMIEKYRSKYKFNQKLIFIYGEDGMNDGRKYQMEELI